MTTPASAISYRKLTRLVRGLGSMSRLCLAPDHLLLLQSNGYTETYRRFYLRDIQALLIVHTARRLTYTILFGFVGLLGALIVLANDGGAAVWLVFLAPLVALLLWNFFRGPGCRLVIVTAVQQESVAAVTRVPKARQLLKELRPLIEAAQADLAVSSATATAAVSEVSEPPLVAQPPALPPPLPSA